MKFKITYEIKTNNRTYFDSLVLESDVELQPLDDKVNEAIRHHFKQDDNDGAKVYTLHVFSIEKVAD